MTPMEKLLSQVDWRPTGQTEGELYATHDGTIHLGPYELRVYQLNDGQRVFDARDAVAMLSEAEEWPAWYVGMS